MADNRPRAVEVRGDLISLDSAVGVILMDHSDDTAIIRTARPTRRALVALASIVGVVAGGCGETPAPPEPPPPKVTVQHPEERALVDYDRYTGWTRPSEIVEVRSRVRGHIKRVHFVDGEMVKKGDLLFELDPRPFKADVERARDALAVDEAQLEFAAAEAVRNQQLFEKSAVSKAELEKFIASRKTWEAKVEAAKEEITSAELELEYSRITAETSGRISRAMLTDGNLVNAGGSDPLLTTIVAVDPIHVYFSVDERSLLKFRQGRAALKKRDSAAEDPAPNDSGDTEGAADTGNGAAAAAETPAENGTPETQPGSEAQPQRAARRNEVKSAKITFDFGFEIEKGYPHQGLIDFADNRIDPDTGTVEIRGFAPNPEAEYFPGARVRVQIPISDEYRAILVPDTAILSDQDQRYVLVLTDENVVVNRSVTLGRLLPDGMRVILPPSGKREGLTATDWVIVLGLQRARVNYPVEPVDADGKPIVRTAK